MLYEVITTAENLVGALKTGILTHIFVEQQIAQEVVLKLVEQEFSVQNMFI